MHPAAAAGFIAGDGYLWAGTRRFALVVHLAIDDRASCESLQRAFGGAGTIRELPSRGPGQRPTVVFRINRLDDLATRVVPLLDAWLPPCHRRSQFEPWRDAILRQVEVRRRSRECTIDGCVGEHRARGLCRHHYFVQFGR